MILHTLRECSVMLLQNLFLFCGGVPPHPRGVRRCYALRARVSVPQLTRCVAHAICCQAAILNTLSIRMAVLSFFSFCATLTSEARGCKLLHKRCGAKPRWSTRIKEKRAVGLRHREQGTGYRDYSCVLSAARVQSTAKY